MLEKIDTHEGSRFVFTYEASYLSGAGGIPVSMTMPLRAEPYVSVELPHPFNGLIPEGWFLDFAIHTLAIERHDRFSLLQTLCRDNIGAIEVFPEERGLSKGQELLGPVEIEATDAATPHKSMLLCMSCLERLPSRGHNWNFHEACSQKLFGTPKPPTPSFAEKYLQTYAEKAIRKKMSLSGVQPKFPGVFKLRGRTSIVLPGQFIFKPEPEAEFRDLPYFELLGMALAARLKISSAERGVIFSDSGKPIYVTRRFDRRPEKIHVEDMAQILRRTQGDDKYAGSLESALDKLREISGAFQALSAERFAKLCLFNYLLQNSDNHHKNHSIVILPPATGGTLPRVTLSPAYDVLPTSPFIDDRDQVAVAICGKKSNVTKNNWVTFFERAGLGRKHVEEFIRSFAGAVPFIEHSLEGMGIENRRKDAYLKAVRQRVEFLESGCGTNFALGALSPGASSQDLTEAESSKAHDPIVTKPMARKRGLPPRAKGCAFPGCADSVERGRRKYCNRHGEMSDKGELPR